MDISKKVQSNMRGISGDLLPKPYLVCETENDYFLYVACCQRLILEHSMLLSGIDCHKEDYKKKVNEVTRLIDDAQLTIGLCYSHLRKLGHTANQVQPNVYTTTMSHERR